MDPSTSRSPPKAHTDHNALNDTHPLPSAVCQVGNLQARIISLAGSLKCRPAAGRLSVCADACISDILTRVGPDPFHKRVPAIGPFCQRPLALSSLPKTIGGQDQKSMGEPDIHVYIYTKPGIGQRRFPL